MSAVIALAALLFHHFDVARAAMWVAAVAVVLSSLLLILDLGSPHLFVNMLRVFKPQSAMSMGAWILTAFGGCVVSGLIGLELTAAHAFSGAFNDVLHTATGILIFSSAIFGTLLATYTGVLIGATAIPAWFLHRVFLPIHFGTAGPGPPAGRPALIGPRNSAPDTLRFLPRRATTTALTLSAVHKQSAAGSPHHINRFCSRRRTR